MSEHDPFAGILDVRQGTRGCAIAEVRIWDQAANVVTAATCHNRASFAARGAQVTRF